MKQIKPLSKLFVIALFTLFTFVACNNQPANTQTQKPADSTAASETKTTPAAPLMGGGSQVAIPVDSLLTFDFKTTLGSVIIKYNGTPFVTVSGNREWYTYFDAQGHLYFVDQSSTDLGTTTVQNYDNNSNLSVKLAPPSGSTVNLIGNGDARPGGGKANSSTNIGNAALPATHIVKVEITSVNFKITQ